MPGTTIELKDVNVLYDDYQVLDDVSLVFPEGKTSVIVGPSGCGKSTLLKVAASIIPPDFGKVLYNGKDAYRLSERQMLEFRRSNGFIFQDAALWANKSILQNLSLPLEYHVRNLKPGEIRRRIDDMLSRIGLAENLDLRPSQLSQGEVKLVSIARALILNPDIVFMDSPLSGLDSDSFQKFLEILKSLKTEGKTLILTNNDPELTSKFAECLYVLKNGRLLASGDFNTVIATKDEEVKGIIKSILDQAPTYDGNILDLLGPSF